MTDAELRALIRDTVLVWGGDATLTWEGDGLRVAVADGRAATLSRGGPERWLLQVDGRRPRPCASIVAVLVALRNAVGPAVAAPRLRVAAHG